MEENQLNRTLCSRTIADMMNYMEQQAGQDRLIPGLHKSSDNPFHILKCSIV